MSGPSGPLIKPLQRPDKALKTSSLLTYLVTIVFIWLIFTIQSSLDSQTATAIGYPMLLFMAVAMTYIYRENNPDAHPVMRMENLQFDRVGRQVLGALILAILVWVGLLLIIRPVTTPLWSTAISVVFFSFFISAVTQELVFRWIYPQIIYAGAVSSTILFAVSHSQCGPAWLRGEFTGDSLLFFFLAVAFGSIMLAVVWLREADWLPDKSVFKQYFTGLVPAIAIHGSYNATLILFSFRIGTVELQPFMVDPWFGTGAFVLIVLCIGVRKWTRK